MNMIFGLAFLTLAVASPTYEFNNVHEYMTDEEFKNVFQTERPNVPEYNVTQMSHPNLHERSGDSITRLHLNVFGCDIDLSLNPTDGILAGLDTPVYLASDSPDSYVFDTVDDAMTVVSKMLEDRGKGATFIVNKNDDGEYTFSGTIDSIGLNVKPLPDRLQEQYNRMKRSAEELEYLKNATGGEYYRPFYHVVYKRSGIPDNTEYIGLNVKKNISKINAPRSKRSVPEDIEHEENMEYPEIVYPQILVLIDHASFQLHGQNVYNVLEYMLPFWNNVDIKFRILKSPKVRLNIAGFVIANDSKVFSTVIENNMNADEINLSIAINELAKHMFFLEYMFPFNSYDIAVAMSPSSMFSQEEDQNIRPMLGMSYLNGACSISAELERTDSVVILKDTGAFDGIFVAAHEIGHLIGGNHDGTYENVCSYDSGHLMSADRQFNSNSAHWSDCSLKEFAEFLKHRNATCLRDKPTTLVPVPRVLAGRLLTMDDQCEKLVGTKSCTVGEDGCMQLKCFSKEDEEQCLNAPTAAADGTICDTDKICFYGQCVSASDITEAYTR